MMVFGITASQQVLELAGSAVVSEEQLHMCSYDSAGSFRGAMPGATGSGATGLMAE